MKLSPEYISSIIGSGARVLVCDPDGLFMGEAPFHPGPNQITLTANGYPKYGYVVNAEEDVIASFPIEGLSFPYVVAGQVLHLHLNVNT